MSLFVVTISEALEFNHSEKNSYLLIQRLGYRKELRTSAARVIASMYKYKLINRHLRNRLSGNPFLDSSSDKRTLDNASFKFRRSLLAFKKKALEMRQFEDNTELIFLSKNVDNIGEELEFIKERQKTLKQNVEFTSKTASMLVPRPKLHNMRSNVNKEPKSALCIPQKVDREKSYFAKPRDMLIKSGSNKQLEVSDAKSPMVQPTIGRLHTEGASN